MNCVTIRHQHWHTRHYDSRDTMHKMDEWNSESSPSFHTLIGLRTLTEAAFSTLGNEQRNHLVSWNSDTNCQVAKWYQTHTTSCENIISNGQQVCWPNGTNVLIYNDIQYVHINTSIREKKSCQTNCWVCNLKLTWMKFSDSRPDALYDASSLMAEDCWEAVFMHPLEQMI